LRAKSIIKLIIMVAFVATALAAFSVDSLAQGASGTKDEVFSASDDFEAALEDSSEAQALKPEIRTIAINDLTLVAVIVPDDQKDAKSRLAMVDYNGHDYEIKEGTKIGKNNGYVKEIATTYVIIEEESLNNQGEKIAQEVRLSLPR
jgi:Tfp pilus assembly protein PilP